MAREYVSGTYANGSPFNGYFDLDFSNLTAGGSINAAGRDFVPGRKLNTNNYFDNTSFSLQSTAENKYQITISVTNNAVGGSRTFYNLTFNFIGTNPSVIDSGTYQSTTVRQFSTSVDTTQTNVATSSVSTTPFPPVCFATGTHLRTARGDVAVENLRAGDRAVTAAGGWRTITWIGHRTNDGTGTVLPHDQQPVRIRAGAFGPGLPARDLRLSPGHPVLVGADAEGEGGHLVPIMCLINGTTIAREPVEAVTYWHVELDCHDILLAEGLPAESYLDWGDRPFFEEASDHALHNPDFVVPGLSARCRPVAVDGPVVEIERARLSGVFANGLATDCAWDEAGRFGWIAA